MDVWIVGCSGDSAAGRHGLHAAQPKVVVVTGKACRGSGCAVENTQLAGEHVSVLLFNRVSTILSFRVELYLVCIYPTVAWSKHWCVLVPYLDCDGRCGAGSCAGIYEGYVGIDYQG